MNNDIEVDNDIEVEIQLHKMKIEQAVKKIKYHEDAILRLRGKTEICLHCNGEGKVEVGHSFTKGRIYVPCGTCNGVGKLTKEELCQTMQKI